MVTYNEGESILDKIDILERKMINDRARTNGVMAEFIILDILSYENLKYERGLKQDDNLNEYHGYEVAVKLTEVEEYIRFV